MKKSVFILFLFIGIATGLFSQNFIMNNYVDMNSNFSGAAGSFYLEPYSEYTLSSFLALGEPVKKYTKVNEWLLEQALNEWELLEGEYYLVLCADVAPTRYDNAVGSLVKVINRKGDYEILGAVVATMGTFNDEHGSLTPTQEQIEADRKLGFER